MADQWRHAEGDPCLAEADDWAGGTGICGCTTPDPEPASRCGYVGCGRRENVNDHECDDPAVHARDTLSDHPYLPTRCLSCGHGVVES